MATLLRARLYSRSCESRRNRPLHDDSAQAGLRRRKRHPDINDCCFQFWRHHCYNSLRCLLNNRFQLGYWRYRWCRCERRFCLVGDRSQLDPARYRTWSWSYPRFFLHCIPEDPEGKLQSDHQGYLPYDRRHCYATDMRNSQVCWKQIRRNYLLRLCVLQSVGWGQARGRASNHLDVLLASSFRNRGCCHLI